MLLNPLNRRVRERQGVPRLPGAFPVLGHLPAMTSGLLDLLEYGERRFGTHFWLDMGAFGEMLVCTDADVFELLKNKHVLADLLGEVAPPLRNTMSTQDGDPHRETRAWANPPFQPRGLASVRIGELFATMMLDRIGRWVSCAPIRLADETSELTLSMIFRMLGVDDADIPGWRHIYRDYFLVPTMRIGWPGAGLRRSQRAQAWIDARLLEMVRAVRHDNAEGNEGLLAALVHSIVTSGAVLDDADLLANLRALIHAAHKTTAVTMAWMMIELAQRPDCWDTLCDETKGGEVPRDPAALARFPYAEALFRETLRCHPAFPLAFRRTSDTVEVGGQVMAAGTRLAIPLVLLSRNAALYPDPDAFVPGRWLARDQGLKPIDSLQFGNGSHRCLGYHMAWMQLVQFPVALALTLSRQGLRPHVMPTRRGQRHDFPLNAPSKATRVTFVPAPS